jgi:WD40 repeat protein
MSLQPSEFYVAGGTLPPDSPSYIVRAADEALYAGLTTGQFCYVLTPRQMGKSSLMQFTARRLRAEGYAGVTLDLSKIGTNLTIEQWYYGLFRTIGQQLRIGSIPGDWWEQHAALSPLQRLFTALDEQVLPACPSGLILFVDEIDTVRRLPFSADEFFAAIRERHNVRAGTTEARSLTFCLLGVASPGDLISDPRTTPFNIGLRIELNDFTPTEAAPLAQGLAQSAQHPTPDAQRLLSRVLYWTGGHPYLTQRLCLDLAGKDLAGQAQAHAHAEVDRRCAALFFGSRARQEETNLAFVQNTLLQLTDDVAALLELYRRIRRGRPVPDDPTSPQVMLLCLSGLARPQGRRLVTRNRIYSHVFDLGWITASMPHAEQRRQQAAYRRGALRALAASILLLAVVGGLGWSAVISARRAEQAAKTVSKSSRLYLAERNTTLRKTAEAERSAREARAATERAEQAARAARAATGRAENEARQRNTALALATVARTRERDARLGALTLLSEAQADQGVKELEGGDATGLLDLAASCRTANEVSPDARTRHTALWYHWITSCATELEQIFTQEKISAMQFMPRSGQLVTGSTDGRIRFWNCRTGLPEGPSLTPHGPIDGLAISPNGRYVAASTHDRDWADEARVALWDSRTGRSIPIDIVRAQHALGGKTTERTIFQIVFTPDSRQLAVVASPKENGVIWLFDPATGAQRGQWLFPDLVTRVEFARHAPLALLHLRRPEGPRARLIDTRDQHLVGDWPAERCYMVNDDGRFLVLTDEKGAYDVIDPSGRRWATGNMAAIVTHAAFSRDGQLLALGSDDGRVRLCNPAHSGMIRLDAVPGTVVDIKFSPDGRSLAVQSPSAVAVYRLDTLGVMQRIVSYEGIDQFEYAPDSAALAVRAGSVVRLWRLHPDNGQMRALGRGQASDNGQPIALGDGSQAQGPVFSPDGRLVATVADDETAQVWEVETGRPVSPPLRRAGVQKSGATNRMGFTPDGARLILTGADYRLHCWDWRAGREIWQTPRQDRDIRAMAISPNGRRVATAAGLLDEFCWVRQWDVRTGRLLNQHRERDIANAMAYSPDGTRLLMVGRAHKATIRDAVTAAPIGQPLRHENDIQSLAWSRDGRHVVTCAEDGTAQVWDARSGRAFGLPLRHRDHVNVVAYSPDNCLIATACKNGLVQLWNAATGQMVGAPMVHNLIDGAANQLVFSPNGRLLFTGATGSAGNAGTVRVWEVPSGRLAGYPLVLMDGRYRLSASPDGRWLLGSPMDWRWRASRDHAPNPAALLWHIPQAPNLAPDEIEHRTQALLGLRRNAQGFVEAMSPADWRRLRATIAAAPPAHSSR